MTDRSPRVRKGTLFRFGSVSEMLAFCRERHPTADVQTCEIDGDFLLLVRGAPGGDFESLIVHFEGEQTYAVMLPPDPSGKSGLLRRVRERVRAYRARTAST